MPIPSLPRVARRLGARRGATLVLVAVTMSVLMAFAGIAIDFARMYTFAAQVKTLADAAALSGIQDKKFARTLSQAQTSALALVQLNRVNGTDTARIALADFEPGVWNFGTRTFTAAAWTSAATNAVRVTARYPASWSMARVFGVANRTLSQSSVAALGSQRTSSCLKPFAVPYAALLQRLGQASPYNLSYTLTTSDVNALATASASIDFSELGNNDPNGAPPGSFGFLAFNGNGTPPVAASVAGCTYTGRGVGDTLSAAPGNRWSAGPVRTALQALCGGSGTCLVSNPPILVPLYDVAAGNGSNATFRVKYVGAFKLVSYTNGALHGYLTSIVAQPGSGFSPSPGPVITTALVN